MGLSRTLPVVGGAMLFWLATFAGGLLLVLPALAIAAMFYLTIPVLVVERGDPVDALRRSAALTKGHRVDVCGVILCVLATFLAAMALGYIVVRSVPLPTEENSDYYFGSYQRSVAAAMIAHVVGAMMSVVFTVVYTVTYGQLRRLREGVTAGEICDQAGLENPVGKDL